MFELPLGNRRIILVKGDITQQRVDAMVTAANSGLRGGGGVDGAIHRAAGPELLKACRRIGGCPIGSAVHTPSFQLEQMGVRIVIHAVGPVWKGGTLGEEKLLQGAYFSALSIAEKENCSSIAFPSIGTGVYGYPVDLAAKIATSTAYDFLEKNAEKLKTVMFVLFDKGTYQTFEQAAQSPLKV